MSDDTFTNEIFPPHPAYGAYVAHHPSRRLALIIRAGVAYTISVLVVQLLFANVPDDSKQVIVPLLYGIVASAGLWYVLHLWNREVILFEKGFTYRQGSRLGQFRYDEIAIVRQNIENVQLFGILRRTVYDYQMTTAHDEHLKITNVYTDTGRLINRLDSFIARERLPHLREKLTHGQAIWFGDWLKVTRDGLEQDGRSLYWQALQAFRVKDGHLILQSIDDEQWARLPVPELDNVVLLIAILKVHMPQQKGVTDE